MKMAKTICVLAPLMLFTQSCIPPAIRSAHSLEKGGIALEVGRATDQASHQARLLTLTGNDSVSLRAEPVMDAMVVVGLGAGVEVGVGSNLMVKYSIIDEQRKDVPFSLALKGSAAIDAVSGGVLLSRHQRVSDGFAVRPILNVLYTEHGYQAVTSLPEVLQDPDVPTSSPEMWTRMETRSVDVPVGLEMPITVGEKLALTPAISFTYSAPIAVDFKNFSCEGCAFAIERYETGVPMRFWFGMRLQPKLVVGRGGAL